VGEDDDGMTDEKEKNENMSEEKKGTKREKQGEVGE
jgi:hypothetical protein